MRFYSLRILLQLCRYTCYPFRYLCDGMFGSPASRLFSFFRHKFFFRFFFLLLSVCFHFVFLYFTFFNPQLYVNALFVGLPSFFSAFPLIQLICCKLWSYLHLLCLLCCFVLLITCVTSLKPLPFAAKGFRDFASVFDQIPSCQADLF